MLKLTRQQTAGARDDDSARTANGAAHPADLEKRLRWWPSSEFKAQVWYTYPNCCPSSNDLAW